MKGADKGMLAVLKAKITVLKYTLLFIINIINLINKLYFKLNFIQLKKNTFKLEFFIILFKYLSKTKYNLDNYT
jgi:hypothetical protein